MVLICCQIDGSVALWDLREATSLHRNTETENSQYSLRYPTYDTGTMFKPLSAKRVDDKIASAKCLKNFQSKLYFFFENT